jgi:hypothetical protein
VGDLLFGLFDPIGDFWPLGVLRWPVLDGDFDPSLGASWSPVSISRLNLFIPGFITNSLINNHRN